jgi:hypothetical protein
LRPVSRPLWSVVLVLLFSASVVLPVVSGCGSGDGKPSKHTGQRQAEEEAARGERGGESEEEESGGKALKGIPRLDRSAYVQLGVAISELRTGAAVLSIEHRARMIDALALRRLRPRLESLRPRDPDLARIRDRLLVAVERATRSRRAGPRRARRFVPRTLAAADSLYRQLKRYTSSHPGIRALLPD